MERVGREVFEDGVDEGIEGRRDCRGWSPEVGSDDAEVQLGFFRPREAVLEDFGEDVWRDD